jgi:hypothetical protein
LWFALQGAVGRGELEAQSVSYNTRTDSLIAELQRLRSEKGRPSTALQTETLLLEVQLVQRLCSQEPPDAVLRSLQDVVVRSGGLVGYPLKPLVEYLTQIGQVLEGLTAYDDLFETIVQVASQPEMVRLVLRGFCSRGGSANSSKGTRSRQSRPWDELLDDSINMRPVTTSSGHSTSVVVRMTR